MKKNKILFEYNGGDGERSVYEGRVTKNEFNDQRVELRFYKGDQSWCIPFRGATAAELKDNGSNVKIKLYNGQKIELDYSDLVDLMLLLVYYEENSGFSNFFSSYKKFKKKKKNRRK